MGTTSTQERYLEKHRRILRSYGGSTSIMGDLRPLTACQRTTSFRTSFEEGLQSDIDIDGWIRVTRNGFTSNSTRFDNGHDFFTTKTSCRLSHPSWTFSTSGFKTEGPLVPALSRGAAPYSPEPVLMNENDLALLGSRAVSMTAPTRSCANLATFLGEFIADGLPKLTGLELLRDRASSFKGRAGSEYLNVQFGWAPLVADLKELVNALLNASKEITQYARDSGKVVRRRANLGEENFSSSKEVNDSLLWLIGYDPSWLSPSMPLVPVLTRTSVTTRRTWFSGAYSYYLDVGSTTLDRLMRFEEQANHLLGLRITPDVLWELTPWSWLVDWFSNVGDVLTNATLLSTDGMILRYGYLMRHTVTVDTYRSPGVTFKGGAQTGPISVTFRRETKERRKASPYGFGIDIDSLSAKQWSILAALGLTRGPRSLR